MSNTAADPKHRPEALPLLRKPMARAARVPLVERVVELRLSAAALEVIFDEAEVLSEGRIFQGQYFGSTMVTITLSTLAARLRIDAPLTPLALAQYIEGDARIQKRLSKLAELEAVRTANVPFAKITVDLKTRADETCVYLDADVEATLRKP